MSTTQTPSLSGVEGEARTGEARSSRYDPAFDAAVMAAPIVDNASTRLYYVGELEPDRRECDACGDRFQDVGDDQRLCDACQAIEPDDEPHYYVCPTCGGNGCGPCRGTGERLNTTAGAR